MQTHCLSNTFGVVYCEHMHVMGCIGSRLQTIEQVNRNCMRQCTCVYEYSIPCTLIRSNETRNTTNIRISAHRDHWTAATVHVLEELSFKWEDVYACSALCMLCSSLLHFLLLCCNVICVSRSVKGEGLSPTVSTPLFTVCVRVCVLVCEAEGRL